MDNVTEGSSEINPHPQDIDNQGMTENSTSEADHPNLEREERVENRQEVCNGEEQSNKMEPSNTEEASNTEKACKSSQGDQSAVGCEMEGERCSVSQPVEQDGDRPEFECHGRETSKEREAEVQPTIITVCVVGYIHKTVITITALTQYYFKVTFSVAGIDCYMYVVSFYTDPFISWFLWFLHVDYWRFFPLRLKEAARKYYHP